MPPASPIPMPPPWLRHHTALSSSPSSTFDNAPGNHYLQQLDPEPEPEPESLSSDSLMPSSPPPPVIATSSPSSAAATTSHDTEHSRIASRLHPRSKAVGVTHLSSVNVGASTSASAQRQRPSPSPSQQQQQQQQQQQSNMPYGVPSFYHSAATAGHPYSSFYNPSDVELSTIGMGMSMYETLNPLAATMISMGPGVPGVAGTGRAGKRGVYAPIDASYYSAYTQAAAAPLQLSPSPLSPYGGGGGGVAESIYGAMSTVLGFGGQNGAVNPRYISGKSEGAVNGGRDREAVLKRVMRDSGALEEQLQQLVQAQEVALGIAPEEMVEEDVTTPTASMRVSSPRESVYTTRSGGNRSGSSVRGRKRKMGIKEVRRGILDAMLRLADVKAVEEEWYTGEIYTRAELVDAVEKWMKRRQRLEKEVERVEGGREGKEMDKVRERLEGVEEQIRVHEAELSRLRSEQSGMLSKISELQSTLSSRLSSYTDSIQKMSKDMTDFLKSPNALLPTPDTKATLPFTPEQAVDYWADERSVLDGKKGETSRELDALKDGISIWQETVGLIADFENMMAQELVEAQKRAQIEAQKELEAEAARRKMERSRSPQIRSSVFGRGLEGERPSSAGTSSGRNTPVSVFANRNRNRSGLVHSRAGSLSSSTETFKPGVTPSAGTVSGPSHAPTPKAKPKIPEATAAKLVAGIDNIISQLNSRLTLAEQKKWTLLVCVLGAEMESYKEARAALVPLVGGLVDTSATPETVEKAKNKGKGKEKMASGLASPSSEALNESLNGLSVGASRGHGHGHGFDGSGMATGPPAHSNQHHNHWHSESESEIDDPAALFGAEQADGGDSSPELRMSPRLRRLRALSEEEDELEYAAFASLNLQDNSGEPAVATAGDGSARNTVVGEGVQRAGKGKLVDDGDGNDIHGAFLERRDSGEKRSSQNLV
ncbi:hypothetical protein DRE_07776 [Drechslerella stenobrocha 248]|uniref:Uncharacterized protein n=1 Tax=Drechslerella stenobrocha 248 TaxID=1043628 RepID=W7HVV6_9PEZI|nr:hypothetical protein DRE_07776 [Drechslerella stenobrocha 248]